MKGIITLLCLLASISTFAQKKATYKVGDPYKYLKAQTLGHFPNQDQTKTLIIKQRGVNLFFQKFDNKSASESKLLKVNIYDELNKYSSIMGFSELGGKVFCFYTFYEFKEKNWIVKCREIDTNASKFVGESKELFKTNKNYPSTYKISNDGSKIMFYARNYPKHFRDKINYDVFSFNVFDKDLKKVNAAEITMPYTEKKMDPVYFLIQSNGTPTMLSLVFNDDSRDLKKKEGTNTIANYHYEVFQIDLGTKSILRSDLTLDNTPITELFLAEGKNNTIFASGFYSNKNTENLRVLGIPISKASVDGLCLFNIDDIGNIISNKKLEIPNEVIHQYEKSSNKKATDSEISNLQTRNIIMQEDGSKIIIAEQIYDFLSSNTSFTSNGQMISGSDINYRFDDIIICKLSASDEIVWIKKLPKRQQGKNSFMDLSFSYQNLNNNHYIIFLDNLKNKSLNQNQIPAAHVSEQWGYLTYYKVDDELGKVTKQSVFTTKGIRGGKGTYLLYYFRPNEVIKTSEKSFMMEFYKKFNQDIMIQVVVE